MCLWYVLGRCELVQENGSQTSCKNAGSARVQGNKPCLTSMAWLELQNDQSTVAPHADDLAYCQSDLAKQQTDVLLLQEIVGGTNWDFEPQAHILPSAVNLEVPFNLGDCWALCVCMMCVWRKYWALVAYQKRSPSPKCPLSTLLNILLVSAEFLLKFLPKILAISNSLNFTFGKQFFGSLSCAWILLKILPLFSMRLNTLCLCVRWLKTGKSFALQVCRTSCMCP